MTTIPDEIVIDSEFFDSESKYRRRTPERLVGKVLAILRDTEGDQYCAFELPDIQGVHIIHLGSNFFRGWDP